MHVNDRTLSAYFVVTCAREHRHCEFTDPSYKRIRIKQKIRVECNGQYEAPPPHKIRDYGLETGRTPQASITWGCSRELALERVSCEVSRSA
jgi:hypothetical protein